MNTNTCYDSQYDQGYYAGYNDAANRRRLSDAELFARSYDFADGYRDGLNGYANAGEPA